MRTDIALSIVTVIATVVLAWTSWAALRATVRQSREVVRREHLRKLQVGALAELEGAFRVFWGDVFEGIPALKYREQSDSDRLGAPARFDFGHPLRNELECHFGGLWRAICDLKEDYDRFTDGLFDRAERTLSQWAPDRANGEDPRWKSPMLAYLFTRALQTADDFNDLKPSWPVSFEGKRFYLNILRRVDPDRSLTKWARQEVEALWPRYDACRAQFALAREPVTLQGNCDLVGDHS
ncbi:MAG TPA: hypothetical protein VE996_13330 [Terriglobales bacterium]|nr:hypothetical protein [Terriglobales bacterium]